MRMTKAAAVRKYGSMSKIARLLKISPQAVQKWGRMVPRLRQFELDEIERRELRRSARMFTAVPHRSTIFPEEWGD